MHRMQNFILRTLDLLQYHYSARYPGKRKKNLMLGGKENMQTLCLFHNILQV